MTTPKSSKLSNEKRGKGGTRFIISHRRAGKADADARKASRSAFDHDFHKFLASSVDVLGDSASRSKTEGGRRVVFFEGSREELARKRKDLGADVMIEPERPRWPMVFNLAEWFSGTAGLPNLAMSAEAPLAQPAGSGTSLDLKVVSKGAPIKDVTVILVLASKTSGQTTNEQGQTGEDGKISFPYDASVWVPKLVVVEPKSGYWPTVAHLPASGLAIELPELPKAGPMGWWQALAGNPAYDQTRGQGIRVGIVDTGVGPHPYLAQVKGIGAFISGNFDSSADASKDVLNHGTHVAGIIGARPADKSGDYGGIASGAELFMARVFPPGQPANQGDIASAIDELANAHEVDLINMSLGGAASEIELDAILAALENGTLCVCAAGNNSGGPVLYPAAYAQTVAVSALGLLGVDPPGTTSAANIPTTPDKFTPWGLYLANFSSVGPEVTCIAAGNGIISTVPSPDETSATYLAMDGTSMASPVCTGALAALLGADPNYGKLPRTAARATYAVAAMQAKAKSLGLNPTYQGIGLVRA